MSEQFEILIHHEERLVTDVEIDRGRCGTCLHWRPSTGVMRNIIRDNGTIHPEGSGDCVAMPPSVPPSPGDYDQSWHFPMTLSGQGCGMWRVREHNGKLTRLKY